MYERENFQRLYCILANDVMDKDSKGLKPGVCFGLTQKHLPWILPWLSPRRVVTKTFIPK